MTRVLVVWGNWGPYHYARFEAFRRAGAEHGFDVQGLELFASSGIYAWKTKRDVPGVHHLDLGPDEMAFRLRGLLREVAPLIFRLRPQVIFVPSYWHWSLFVNAVARIAGARVVMMNESHAGTERATGFKKFIKRCIVSSFHAALVGGTPHRNYFSSLGLPAERIFLGYDAVDNAHFMAAAAAARADASGCRARLGLPDRYFLSLGRMVEKKNLSTLLRAFAHVAPAADGRAHDLVYVGSGESEPHLRRLTSAFSMRVVDRTPEPVTPPTSDYGTEGRPAVYFFGFRQIEENPIFYALATAFILPSEHEEWGLVVNEAMACGLPVFVSQAAGCAADLVVEGENGRLFDSSEILPLADHLQELVDDPALAARMGAASAERIRHWGCERFADGAIAATRTALAR